MKPERVYGLIGKELDHSFSPQYFADKFTREGIEDATYTTFPLEDVSAIKKLKQRGDVKGLNVTIPYKEAIIPYLDVVTAHASAIGAVNTIQIKDGLWIGHNTDWMGFNDSLNAHLKDYHSKALILGTGGAAKAVSYALKQRWIPTVFVSRNKQGENTITYADLNHTILEEFLLIINTTPLGMHPHVDASPHLPYASVSHLHFAYDLIYNPKETRFLERCKAQGAQTLNGLDMLHLQAEASWRIWQGA